MKSFQTPTLDVFKNDLQNKFKKIRSGRGMRNLLFNYWFLIFFPLTEFFKNRYVNAAHYSYSFAKFSIFFPARSGSIEADLENEGKFLVDCIRDYACAKFFSLNRVHVHGTISKARE